MADTFVIIAVTGKTTDKRGRTMKEISAVIVEKDDKGFSQGKHEKKMGIRGSSTCDLIFEDCVIPKDRMLGKKGEGFKIAMKKQNHEPYSMDAAMAKLFAAEAASDVTRRAVQLFGGYGYTREYPVERMMRDAKITEIYEGTSEVQRMVIASNLGVK